MRNAKHMMRCQWMAALWAVLIWSLQPVEAQLEYGTPPTLDRQYGFADLHSHQFANLGFGGRMIIGSPFVNVSPLMMVGLADETDGHAMALHCCGSTAENTTCGPSECLYTEKLHGSCGVSSTVEMSAEYAYCDFLPEWLGGKPWRCHHAVSGYPEFEGWPHWKSITHQQVYYKWLQRAWEGGLRLMVMLAVDNPILCDFLECELPGNNAHECNWKKSVRLQIQATKDLEDYIDWLDDGNAGNNTGWYRVVTSAKEARRVIEEGKLAVVLGIEMPDLGGCLGGRCGSGGDVEIDWQEEIDFLIKKGVRHFFPIHVFDNDFGGAAVFMDLMNEGNRLAWEKSGKEGAWFDVYDCSSEGFEFKFDKQELPWYVEMLTCAEGEDVRYPDYYEDYQAHCNSKGLTALGDELINYLIQKGMIIDVDHMSYKMRQEVFHIATNNCYPLVSSHCGFIDLSKGHRSYEQSRYLRREIETIRDLGGMIAPIISPGHSCETEDDEEGCIRTYSGSGVSNDCSTSSKTWAQVYRYAVDRMDGVPVAMGTDFNGGIGKPSPRYGGDACNQMPSVQYLSELVSYPFEPWLVKSCSSDADCGEYQECDEGRCKMAAMEFGSKTFTINSDGLAHVGLLPDFIEDLRQVGLSRDDLEPLFLSAEAYVAMWEKIEAIAPIVYVNDSDRGDCGGGIPENPYTTIELALKRVNDDGDVIIKKGNYPGSFYIDQSVVLWADGGDVMIGQ